MRGAINPLRQTAGNTKTRLHQILRHIKGDLLRVLSWITTADDGDFFIHKPSNITAIKQYRRRIIDIG